MTRRKRYACITFPVVILLAVLTACNQASQNPSPTEAVPEPTATEEESDEEPPKIEVTRIVVETEVVEVSPEPDQIEIPQKELVVCLGSEPESLYPYSQTRLEPAALDVLAGLYEPMVTTLSYDYQAHGITKLPSLVDGDARIEPVTVTEGDRVFNTNKDIVELREGTQVREIGGDVVIYNGEPIIMPQLSADFTLQPLVWSDGQPVTADDSVYSFELAADDQTPVIKQDVSHTASYESIGERSIRWTAIPGFLDTNYFEMIWSPLPRHAWGEFTPAELLDKDISTRSPLSHGPYVIQQWIPGEELTLVRNEHYYLADQGYPKVDTIHFRFFPSTSLLQQLLAGECDIVTHDGLSFSEAQLLLEAEANGQLVPYFQQGTVFEHIDFGIVPVEEYAATQPEWFDDPHVRQAITMCLDRQAMVDDLLFGRSEVLNAYVPSIHPFYPADIVKWPYDLDLANQLLDEAGFPFPEEGDVRNDALSGTPFEITLFAATGNQLVEAVTARVKEDLALCGIDVQIELMHADQYFADGPEGPLFGRKFDLAAFPWLISIEPNCALYHSAYIPGPANNWNINYNNETGFSDEEFDAACDAALAAIPGTHGYGEDHSRALQIWSEQVPIIPLFMRLKVAATRPGVLNFQIDSTEPSDLWNLYEIDLE